MACFRLRVVSILARHSNKRMEGFKSKCCCLGFVFYYFCLLRMKVPLWYKKLQISQYSPWPCTSLMMMAVLGWEDTAMEDHGDWAWLKWGPQINGIYISREPVRNATESDALGWSPTVKLSEPARWLWYLPELENHWSEPLLQDKDQEKRWRHRLTAVSCTLSFLSKYKVT